MLLEGRQAPYQRRPKVGPMPSGQFLILKHDQLYGVDGIMASRPQSIVRFLPLIFAPHAFAVRARALAQTVESMGAIGQRCRAAEDRPITGDKASIDPAGRILLLGDPTQQAHAAELAFALLIKQKILRNWPPMWHSGGNNKAVNPLFCH